MADADLLLILGNKNLSSWSLRPWVLLRQAGIAFRERVLPFETPGWREAIEALSPSRRVPALHHGDLVVWDSLAICEYVAELDPAANLWPADRAQRAIARAVSAEMHAGFPALRRDMPMDLIANKAGQGHTAEALADARRVMAIWRDQLAVSKGPFLFGAFTIADAMFAPVTTRFTTYGVDLDETCRVYVDAVQALPAFVAWKRDAAAEPATRP